MKKYKLVKVEWDDAYSASQWHDQEEIDDMIATNLFKCSNVGWLIKQNKEAILVAARMGEGANQFGLIERLPKKMIKKITYLT